jgi:putative ABC transport system permease protein
MLRVATTLAYRQLMHHGVKLGAALLGVCVAIVLIFTQLGFRNALYDSAVGIPRAFDADIIVAGPTFNSWGDVPPWMARGVLFEAAGVSGVASVAPLYSASVQIASPVDGHNLSATLLGFPVNVPVFLPAGISRYRPDLMLPETVIMDGGSRQDFQDVVERTRREGSAPITFLNANETLQKTARVAGLYEVGPSFTIDGTIIASDLNFYRITGIPLDRVSVGLVRVTAGASPQAVKERIKARLGNRAKIFLKSEFIDNEIAYYADNTPVGYIFNLGLVVGVFVGVVFVSQALHGIVSDNMREYATLRAMGYHRGFFVTVVAAIALAISLAAYVPSSLAAWGVYALAGSATHLPLRMNLPDMVSILLLVVTMGLGASLLAARKIRNADPLDLFV